MQLFFRTINEAKPGLKWKQHFNDNWHSYKRWYLSEGERNRSRFLTCQKRVKEFMPEIFPIYEKLVELAGGGDLEARFLSLYTPPPFLSGCSQSVWLNGFPALVRNYDYSPVLFEAIILQTNWLQPVIAVSDCVWGVVDGINEAGLSVSLAFGGSKDTGFGFGIPLILRYVLEVCKTTEEAIEALKRIPAHMAYNVTVLDSNFIFATAYVSPHEPTRVYYDRNATNHQETIQWQAYADSTRTIERKKFLDSAIINPTYTFHEFVKLFLNSPMYSHQYSRGFGTLYTSIYYPQSKMAEYVWPGYSFILDFHNTIEPEIMINYF